MIGDDDVLDLENGCFRAVLPEEIGQLLADVVDRAVRGVENDLAHGLEMLLVEPIAKQTRVTGGELQRVERVGQREEFQTGLVRVWSPDDMSDGPVVIERGERVQDGRDGRERFVDGHVEAEFELFQAWEGIVEKDLPAMATRNEARGLRACGWKRRLLEVVLIGGCSIEVRESFEFRGSDATGHEKNETIEIQLVAGDVQLEIDQIDRWLADQRYVERRLIGEHLHAELLQARHVLQQKQKAIKRAQRDRQLFQILVVDRDIGFAEKLKVIIVVHLDADRLEGFDLCQPEEVMLQAALVARLGGRRRRPLDANVQVSNGHVS